MPFFRQEDNEPVASNILHINPVDNVHFLLPHTQGLGLGAEPSVFSQIDARQIHVWSKEQGAEEVALL